MEIPFSFQTILSRALGMFSILLIVFILWYIMWKFVFEPNPIIREFFDLDIKKDPKRKIKKTHVFKKEH